MFCKYANEWKENECQNKLKRRIKYLQKTMEYQLFSLILSQEIVLLE